jgi:hypothetical protein
MVTHQTHARAQTLLRLIPSEARRDDKVVGGRPGNSAAPPSDNKSFIICIIDC